MKLYVSLNSDEQQLEKVNDKDSEPMQIDEPDQLMVLTVPALNFAATDSENSQATPSVVSPTRNSDRPMSSESLLIFGA